MNPKALRMYPPGVLDRQASRRPRRTDLVEALTGLYPDPQMFLSAADFLRGLHADVRDLSDEALENERLLSRQRRAAEAVVRITPSPWFAERIARLETEATRRRAKAAQR
jgi:hypothetical protein